jgi:Putative adhesin
MNSPEQSFAEPMYDPREVPEWRGKDFRLQTEGPEPPRGRSRWFWPGVSLLILVAIFGGLATADVALTHEVTTTKTVTIGSAPRLILTSQTGDVHVVDGPAGQIQVVMRQRVLQGNNHLLPVHFDLSPDGNTLTITSNQGPGVNINFFDYSTGVDFTISVPSQTALDIHTDSGDITSQGIDGQMTLTTSSGDVSTDGGAGQITLASSSGDISASNVSGHLQLSTSSGDIRATNASATADSTFHTDSGDITYLGTLAPSASFGFDTSSGDVRLTLPGSPSFQVRASTDSGSIDSQFSTVTVLSGDGSGAVANGIVGSPPYAQISIQVSSGDIHLLAA